MTIGNPKTLALHPPPTIINLKTESAAAGVPKAAACVQDVRMAVHRAQAVGNAPSGGVAGCGIPPGACAARMATWAATASHGGKPRPPLALPLGSLRVPLAAQTAGRLGQVTQVISSHCH
jgi:hypothetical protein